MHEKPLLLHRNTDTPTSWIDQIINYKVDFTLHNDNVISKTKKCDTVIGRTFRLVSTKTV